MEREKLMSLSNNNIRFILFEKSGWNNSKIYEIDIEYKNKVFAKLENKFELENVKKIIDMIYCLCENHLCPTDSEYKYQNITIINESSYNYKIKYKKLKSVLIDIKELDSLYILNNEIMKYIENIKST